MTEILSLIPPVNERNMSGSKRINERDLLSSDISMCSLDDNDNDSRNTRKEIENSYFEHKDNREVITGQSWDFRSEVEEDGPQTDYHPNSPITDSEHFKINIGVSPPIPITNQTNSQLSLPISLAPLNSLSLKAYGLSDQIQNSSINVDGTVEDSSLTVPLPQVGGEVRKGRFSILEAASSSASSLSPVIVSNVSTFQRLPSNPGSPVNGIQSIGSASEPNSQPATYPPNSFTTSSTDSTLNSKEDKKGRFEIFPTLNDESIDLLSLTNSSQFPMVNDLNGGSQPPLSISTNVNNTTNTCSESTNTIRSIDGLIHLISEALNLSSDIDSKCLQNALNQKHICIKPTNFEKDQQDTEAMLQGTDDKSKLDQTLVNSLVRFHHFLY